MVDLIILIKYTQKIRLVSNTSRTVECLMTRWLAVGLPRLRWSVCKPEQCSVSVPKRQSVSNLEVVQQNHPLGLRDQFTVQFLLEPLEVTED